MQTTSKGILAGGLLLILILTGCAGRYDSGITLARFAEEHPQRLRVEEAIGTVVDPWLVYGTRPTCTGALLAWPDSPAAALFRGG